MITSHDASHPNDGHPDDEQLSAFLDGEAATLAGHDTCPTCAARLAELRAVSEWVATAPATPDLRPLVRRALAAVDRRGARPAPYARRQAMAMLAAAAVVAVVLGAAIFLPRGDADRDATAVGAAAVTDGGDLGRQEDPMALASRVRTDLTGEGIEAGAGRVADDGGGAAGTADQSAPFAEGSGDAPSIGARATKGAPVTRLAKGPTPCLAQSAPAAGGGALTYRAKAVWQGTPSVVLGFRLQGEGLTYRLVLMSLAECRLLVVQSF